MKIFLRLKYLTLLIVLVIARRDRDSGSYEYSQHSNSNNDDDNHDVSASNWFGSEAVSKSSEDSKVTLDMTGRLRRRFAMKAALQNSKKNMVCSPLSALLPLGKLALGAGKIAKIQLLKAIGLRTSKIGPSFSKIVKDLENLPGVTLDIASRVYANSEVKVKSSYKKEISKYFKSSIEPIDMENPERAVDKINSWVSRQTRGMIKELLQPDDISSDTSLVMVNAIFFVGFWENPFHIKEEGIFYTPDGERTIPMMAQTRHFKYRKDIVLNSQIVELPYVGEEASFVIVLPNLKHGLPILLRKLKLAPRLLAKALRKMEKIKVSVTMPKFKIKTELDLKDLYKQVGIRRIFKKNSHLTGILEDDPPMVSKAIQKAIIEVNELGTAGAAASGTGMVTISSSIEFKADRPFLFFVKAKSEQLFAGIYNGV